MDINKINSDIREDFQRYRSLMETTLVSGSSLLNTINSYLLQTSGKQLRPLLAILSARACGGLNERTISCAAVAEMIHTATLLHDDVADQSDKRRGVRTVQAEYNPAASILTGDYWLAKSMSILVSLNDARIMGFYTKTVEDLSEGELFQMQKASSLDTTEEDYYSIIYSKTASLFVGTVKSAVFTVCRDENVLSAMEEYAGQLGIAFQIRDDIFDYMPGLDTGKPAGGDVVERKLTLPLIAALNAATENERDKMISMLKNNDAEESLLMEEAVRLVEKYSGIAIAQKALAERCKRAVEALSFMVESEYKRDLILLTRYVGERSR
ncbi:MAG: polyprenyl synthetase family protein [Bacteroidales bacterium]|nr:polyprenyl synthetase family protein [Bacteroidales bacterium]